MRYTVDAAGVDELARDLEQAADKAMPEVERVTERGAYNIRRDARRNVRAASRGLYLRHYPRSIGYDVEAGPDWVEAEVGPEVDKLQGGMGRGVEFGSSKTAPIAHLFPALDAEIPRYERQLARAIDRALR